MTQGFWLIDVAYDSHTICAPETIRYLRANGTEIQCHYRDVIVFRRIDDGKGLPGNRGRHEHEVRSRALDETRGSVDGGRDN